MREIKLWDKKQKKFLTKFYCFYKDGYFEFYNNDRDFKNGIMNTNVVVVIKEIILNNLFSFD